MVTNSMRKSSKLYLDANFFIFAVLDITENGENARKIYNKIVKKEVEATTSSLTLDEVMRVFIKNNKRHLIKSVITDIYQTPNLEILPVSVSVPLFSLDLIEEGLNPRDAFHVTIMKENNIDVIISEDEDFKKIKDIVCLNFKEFFKN